MLNKMKHYKFIIPGRVKNICCCSSEKMIGVDFELLVHDMAFIQGTTMVIYFIRSGGRVLDVCLKKNETSAVITGNIYLY